MAFHELYVQPSASNLNAGSEATDAARLTYASGDWVAATGVFTVASGNPVTDGVVVEDLVSVYADGSTATGFVGIVTARDATTITVSLVRVSGTPPSDGTGNRTLKVGGAWKGPNAAEAFPFNFVAAAMTNVGGDTPRVNFKNGTPYAITAAMTHTLNGPCRFQGYTATPGDEGKFIVDGGTAGASYLLLNISGNNIDLVDAIFQNNGATGNAGGVTIDGAECQIARVVVNSIRGSGLAMNGAGDLAIECETYACNQSNTASRAGISLGGSNGTRARRCNSHDNAGSNSDGFLVSLGAVLDRCIADTNGFNGFNITSVGWADLTECDANNNTADGVRLANASAARFLIENCNLVKNGGYGINGSGAGARNGSVRNCGFGSGTQANTSGQTTGLKSMTETGSVTYPTDATPWIDPATGDFRITLSAAKGTGRGSFTETQAGYSGTVGYPDIGAAQHRDRPNAIPSVGMRAVQ